jgi:hypothetical protein
MMTLLSWAAPGRYLMKTLSDEFDAGQIAAAPDDLAIVSGAGVTRERQPQSRGQRIGAVQHDLGSRGGNVLHHALAHREAAIKRNPCRLPQSFPRLPLFGRRCHLFPNTGPSSPTPSDLSIRLICQRKHGLRWSRKVPTPWLAHPRKRHYTFAAAGGIRLQRFRIGTVGHRYFKPGFKVLIFQRFLNYLCRMARPRSSSWQKCVLLPSSIG